MSTSTSTTPSTPSPPTTRRWPPRSSSRIRCSPRACANRPRIAGCATTASSRSTAPGRRSTCSASSSTSCRPRRQRRRRRARLRRSNALLQELAHVVEVPRDLHFVVEHRPHDALFVDDEGDALRNLDERPEHAERFADALVLVTDERERRLLLDGEATLRVELVGADADDLGAELADALIVVAEVARLHRASHGEGFGKEVDDDRAATERRQRHGRAVGRLGGEIWGVVADLQHYYI